MNDICANCGGSKGIHHYQTDQCPVGGVEAPIGREQEWKTSTWARFAPPFDPPSRLASSMTVREYFAALTMQGLLASIGQHDVTSFTHIASDAVRAADKLIAALNQESK